jgi:hypothetical protein
MSQLPAPIRVPQHELERALTGASDGDRRVIQMFFQAQVEAIEALKQAIVDLQAKKP